MPDTPVRSHSLPRKARFVYCMGHTGPGSLIHERYRRQSACHYKSHHWEQHRRGNQYNSESLDCCSQHSSLIGSVRLHSMKRRNPLGSRQIARMQSNRSHDRCRRRSQFDNLAVLNRFGSDEQSKIHYLSHRRPALRRLDRQLRRLG